MFVGHHSVIDVCDSFQWMEQGHRLEWSNSCDIDGGSEQLNVSRFQKVCVFVILVTPQAR